MLLYLQQPRLVSCRSVCLVKTSFKSADASRRLVSLYGVYRRADFCSFFAVASRTRQQWTKQLGKSRAQDVIVGYANLVLGLIGFCLYWTDKRIIFCCHFRLSTGEGGCLCKSGQTTSRHDDRSATLDGTRSKSSGLFAMLQHRANDVQINALCLLLFDDS